MNEYAIEVLESELSEITKFAEHNPEYLWKIKSIKYALGKLQEPAGEEKKYKEMWDKMIPRDSELEGEVIAEGVVKCDYRMDEVFWLNNHPISYHFEDLAGVYDGTKVKLIIQKCKESK